MHIIALVFVGIVAAEHIYILWLEMFAWTTAGRKAFKSVPGELFEPTKSWLPIRVCIMVSYRQD